MNLACLSDEEVVSNLSSICAAGRRLTARLLVHLGEVEARRLDLKAACSSMFDFCTRRLGMSEGEAHRRLTAARLVRKFPSLLGSLERGEIHLSALSLLSKHMTAQNFASLVEAARGKTKLEVQEIVARLAPRADVFESMVRV